MPSETGREDESEASLLSRRQYLLSTGAVAIGLGSTATAAAAGDDVDVLSVSATHHWTTAEVDTSASAPVVIAPTVSYNGTNPSSPRIRNVSGDSFDARVEEWRYLDGYHLEETIGCFVAPSGDHESADGARFEVGTIDVNHRWWGVSFDASFESRPVVFSNAQTYNGRDPIVTRHRNLDGSGVQVRLQEEEAEGPHLPERVGYLAVEPGTGSIAGRSYEAKSGVEVSSRWREISFDDTYEDPVFIADLQSYRGTNTATLRYRRLTGSSVEVKVEEERSADSETGHLAEDVGYLVVESDATTESGYGLGGFGDGAYGE